MDILFFIEIVQNFLTAYKDTETFNPVFSLKKIALNYIINGSFLVHLLAALPYGLFTSNVKDPEEQILRNLLMLKMLRIQRLSSDFIPDDVLIEAIKWFYKQES